jgi:hypothetical protein
MRNFVKETQVIRKITLSHKIKLKKNHSQIVNKSLGN